jgi:hypothetical protein
MRATLVALSLLAGTGCFYDGPNPWNTSGMVEEWQEKKEHDWQYELIPTFHWPQREPIVLLDPELEAFRDTVLINANGATLERMKAGSQAKLAYQEAWIRSLLKTDEHSRKVLLTEALEDWRIEKIRLRLIDERLAAGPARRD